MAIVFSIMEPNTFATTSNFRTIFGSQAVLVVLTLGLMFPLTVGEFDLSIGAVLGLSAVLVAELNAVHHWSLIFAVLIALVFGVAAGAANGFIVVTLRVDALVATLGMGTLLIGIGLGITNLQVIGGIDQALINSVTTQWFGIPLSFYYSMVAVVIVWYVFRYTPAGRHLLFVGKGRDVARLSGLPVQRIRFTAFVLSGFVSAVAGVMLAGTLGAADPNSGNSFLLPAYAAAFLGTTAINPGRFNPWGMVIAVYFLVTTVTGLELAGLQVWIEQVFYGAALVSAVTLSAIVTRRREASPQDDVS
jgi:ribose transport system permease protein